MAHRSGLATAKLLAVALLDDRGEDDRPRSASTKIGCVSDLSGCTTTRQGYVRELLDGDAVAAVNFTGEARLDDGGGKKKRENTTAVSSFYRRGRRHRLR